MVPQGKQGVRLATLARATLQKKEAISHVVKWPLYIYPFQKGYIILYH